MTFSGIMFLTKTTSGFASFCRRHYFHVDALSVVMFVEVVLLLYVSVIPRP